MCRCNCPILCRNSSYSASSPMPTHTPPTLPLTPPGWRLQPRHCHPVYTSCCCQLSHLTPELLLRGWCAEGVARWLIHTPGHTVTGLPVNMHKGGCCCYLDHKDMAYGEQCLIQDVNYIFQCFLRSAYICSCNAGIKKHI